MILAACIKIGDKLFVGKSHASAEKNFRSALEKFMVGKSDEEISAAANKLLYKSGTKGFLNGEGVFLSRKDAYAEAKKCGQRLNDSEGGKKSFSDDIKEAAGDQTMIDYFKNLMELNGYSVDDEPNLDSGMIDLPESYIAKAQDFADTHNLRTSSDFVIEGLENLQSSQTNEPEARDIQEFVNYVLKAQKDLQEVSDQIKDITSFCSMNPERLTRLAKQHIAGLVSNMEKAMQAQRDIKKILDGIDPERK